jgi:SAM-dependent methyltransferase
MSGFAESVRKEWYRISTARRLAAGEWRGRYWYDEDGCRIVACRSCPKFDAGKQICSVPYGTPLRKCVVGSLESHLHGTQGLRTLELGCGRRSLGKHVVETSGGSWIGIEPNAARRTAEIGKSCYGHAASIPFPNETFDIVFGIQSLEHWEEKQPSIPEGLTYAACLAEVWRVLKVGGSIYFDAPIHLHGHEMFVRGDIPRIRRLFDDALWSDVTLEKWRYDREPLAPYPTSEKEVAAWPSYLPADAVEELVRLGRRSVWLLTITAKKKA